MIETTNDMTNDMTSGAAPAQVQVQIPAADPAFDAWREARLADGFDEVVERRWEPGRVLDDHTHPFSVEARLVQGEMWLTHGGRTQHLRAGDRFALDADVPHAERYGADGATYWVARRRA